MTAPYCVNDHVTLYCGEALDVLRMLPDDSVDAVICDPPYSSGGMFRSDRVQGTVTKYVTGGGAAEERSVHFSGDSRDQRGYAYWSALWMNQARRLTRTGGVLIAFTDWRQLPATTDAIQAGGWVWRGIVPWVKPFGTFRPKGRYLPDQCEFIAWGSNGPLDPIPTDGFTVPPGFIHGRAPRGERREHITQKPIEVMRELVRTVPEGGTVLDPFMGSGTTGVAAVLEGRRFIGVEDVEHYVDVSRRRIGEAALGQIVQRGEQPALDFGGEAS